jgi:glutamyl-tRNA synthetase
MLEALTPDKRRRLEIAIPGLKERAKTLLELLHAAKFLVTERPLNLDDKARQGLTPEMREELRQLHSVLSRVDEWSAATLEMSVKAYAEKAEKKLGKLAQPLRFALTGTSTSPGIYDVLAALGREESLARIADQFQASSIV